MLSWKFPRRSNRNKVEVILFLISAVLIRERRLTKTSSSYRRRLCRILAGI